MTEIKVFRAEYKKDRRLEKGEYRQKEKAEKAAYRSEKAKNKRAYKEAKRQRKKAYRSVKRERKATYRATLSEYYSSKRFTRFNNPPRRGVLEEIGNAVTHGAGSVFSVVALVLMLALASDPGKIAGAIVYFFGLFWMFTMSCLYHSFPWGSRVKRIFRRFDYCGIYLLIGASFTPILLSYIGGIYGLLFCILQWTVIATGITFISVFGPTRLRWLHFPLYIILGWSALLFLPKMIVHDLPLFFYLLGGGLIYSLGIIPFAIDHRVSHFLWHFFVLTGAIIHWVGIYLAIFA